MRTISIHVPLAGHDERHIGITAPSGVFQSTCPLRGTTDRRSPCGSHADHFNPRAPCGARRDADNDYAKVSPKISIHVPLAGHDTARSAFRNLRSTISIHVPLAGHDIRQSRIEPVVFFISIHVPLAGHDRNSCLAPRPANNFNPRAPCGARPSGGGDSRRQIVFQSTCPLRGTTQLVEYWLLQSAFQSTCPLRGTTRSASRRRMPRSPFQSTCPLRGTTPKCSRRAMIARLFQSTCPLRGTTRHAVHARAGLYHFNPRAPCGARPTPLLIICLAISFQSTCPLRGTTRLRRIR